MKTHGHDVQYSLDTSVEDMIATYGNSMSTNWTDPAFEVWRDHTGACIGFQRVKGHAIVWGRPLCEPTHHIISQTLTAFAEYCHDVHLNPIFCCVPRIVEYCLCTMGWSSVSCAADNVAARGESSERALEASRKIRKAERSDLVVEQFDDLPPEPLRKRIDEALAKWQGARSKKGGQVHTSSLTPWRDAAHRRYFVTLGKIEGGHEQPVHGLLVMTRIESGQYIKWSICMRGAPSGTSEYQAAKAIETAYEDGASEVSWGSGAAEAIEPGHHLSPGKIKLLSLVYSRIHFVFGLGAKVAFRRKMGMTEVPEYVCWRHFNNRSLRAILSTIKE